MSDRAASSTVAQIAQNSVFERFARAGCESGDSASAGTPEDSQENAKSC